MSEFLAKWIEIGKKNPWIAYAYDPPLTEKSFRECKGGLAELTYFICIHGNWSLGQAFWVGDLCFMQQIDGGDEWLAIKKDRCFESVSAGYMYKRDPDDWARWLADAAHATLTDCLKLDYRDKATGEQVVEVMEAVEKAEAFGELYRKERGY